LHSNDEGIVLRTHANCREIGDRDVGAREDSYGEHRSERDHTGAGASGCGNTCRGVFENDTCGSVESQAFRAEAIAIRGRLSLRDVLAGHHDLRYRQPDRRQSQLGQCPSTGRDDSPAARRETCQDLNGTWNGGEPSDVRELCRVDPRRLPIRLEIGSRGLHGVARAAPMRDPQDCLRIELMAEGPAAADSLDDRSRIDQNAVEVEEKARTTDLHSP